MYVQKNKVLNQTSQPHSQQIKQRQLNILKNQEQINVIASIHRIIQFLSQGKNDLAQQSILKIRDLKLTKVQFEKYVLSILEEPESFRMLLHWFLTTQRSRLTHSILMVALLVIQIIDEQNLAQQQQSTNYLNKRNGFNNTKSKDFGLSLYNYYFSVCKSSKINYYKEIGQILEKIDIKHAINCYKLYYQAHRNDESKFLLGKLLVEKKDIEVGIIYLNEINYEQYELSGLIMLGKCYKNLKNLKQSLIVFQKVIKIDKEQTSFSTVSHFEIATIFQDMIFHKQSISHYLQSFNLNKRNNLEQESLFWESLIRIARIYAYNNDHITSNNILCKIIDQKGVPTRIQTVAYTMLGKNFKFIGNYNKSLFYFKKLQSIEASFQNLQHIGCIYLCLEKYDLAWAYFNRIFQHDNQNARILTYLAYIKAKQNKIAESQQMLQIAQGYNRAEATTHEYYQQIIQIIYGDSKNLRQIKGKINQDLETTSINLLQTGVALRSSFKNNISLFYLSQAYKMNPTNIQTLYNISFVLFQCQRFESCIFYLKQGLKIKNNEDCLELLCKVYHYLKKDSQKKYYLQKLSFLNRQKVIDFSAITYSYKKFVYGVDITVFPSSSKKNYCKELLVQGLNYFKMFNKKQSIEKLQELYGLVCLNSLELLEYSRIVTKNKIVPISYKFYRQYFYLKPFDRQAWKQYLDIISQRQNVTQTDLAQLIKVKPSGIKQGEPFFKLAKFFQRFNNCKKIFDYAVEAIAYQHNQQYYNYLYCKYSQAKLSHEQAWRRILNKRPDYWRAHQQVAKSLQGSKQRQTQFIFHLQKVLQYSWKWQWSLLKLCQVYKGVDRQKYLMYAQKLIYFQRDNFILFYNIAQAYEQINMQKESIYAYCRSLELNPTYQPTYSALQKIYHRNYQEKIEKYQESEQKICYSLQNSISQRIMSDSLLASFWYRHYNRLEESFSCFMLWVQQIKYIQDKQLRLKTLSNKMRWISMITNDHEDRDAELKLYILQKLRGNNEQAFKYFSSLVFKTFYYESKERRKNCLKFITYFQKDLLCYSSRQIQCIFYLFLQQVQNISSSKAAQIKKYLYSRYPSMQHNRQNNPLLKI